MMNVSQILNRSTRNPQSILKIVLGLAVVMLVIWMFLISKMDVSDRSAPKAEGATQGQTQSLKQSLLQKETGNEATVKPAAESSDMFQRALPTFAVMIVTLGGVWLWSRRKDKISAGSKDVREVDDYVLGQGAQLKFLEINHEIWVLGLTSSSVDLLHRVPKGDWTDELSQPELSTKDFKSFYNLLKN